MRILMTGAAGYIGSHTLPELLAAQHETGVVDNYSNSAPEALDRVARLNNQSFVRVTACPIFRDHIMCREMTTPQAEDAGLVR